MYDVIIIGGGPAGSTAALYTARSGLKTLVLDKGVKSGALGITAKIANYPGVPGEMVGAELVEIMQKQAESFGAEYVKDKVTGAIPKGDVKKVFTAERKEYEARALILATGAMGKSTTVPGEEKFLGRGVSYCATCDAPFFKEKTVLVAGSTHEAAEEALFLTRFASQVIIASPKSQPEADAHLKAKLISSPKIKLMGKTRLKSVEGNGTVSAAVLSKGKDEERVEVSGVFIFGQGNKPIVDFLQGQVDMTPGGCLLINKMHETKMDGVFACGDVICNDVQQAVVAAAQGCIAALAVDKYLNKREKPLKDYK